MDKLIIQRNYNEIAPDYDRTFDPMEILYLRRLRKRLLTRAQGQILEIAVGTGSTLPCYNGYSTLTAVDLSPGMLSQARQRAIQMGLQIDFAVMDGERLAFPDAAFDTVVDSLTLCTYTDPVTAVKEMARVLKPGGSLLMLEHGRSNRSWLGRFQDRRGLKNAAELGCHWNREPLLLLLEAGVQALQITRHFLGIFHLIEAAHPSS